ncbi:MAG: 4'-phosphopantetheinyl transferase superfamily protein [Myxococcales bacterium]|nr:4'-phosphopantetheinyl transferase superfamily protein [Myxococcales bacterium]
MDEKALRKARAALLARLPSGVSVRIAGADYAPTDLLVGEADHLERAVPARIREFSAGRSLAREGLAELGGPAVPILRGAGREPLWPEGFIGSITHCKGLVCAVVGRRTTLRSIGVDAEHHARLSGRIEPRVLTPGEALRLEGLAAAERSRAAGLIFSAKEVVHKNVAPLFGRNLGFHDVSIHVEREGAHFSVRAESARAKDLPWHAFQGRFAILGETVFTAGYFPA